MKNKYIMYIVCLVVLVGMVIVAYFFGLSHREKSKEKKEWNKNIVVELGKYVYVDRGFIIHTKKDCNAIYKEHNAQSINIVPVRYIWAPNSGLKNICSKCVNEQQIEQLDSIVSSIAYINRRWLYLKTSDRFDVNDWRSFNIYLDDIDNRREVYNENKNKYDLGTFEEFNDYMTNY